MAAGRDALAPPTSRTASETAFGENRGETRRFARTMIDAGADAVLLSGVLRIRLATDGRLLGRRLVPVRLESPGVPRLDSRKRSVSLVGRLSPTATFTAR